MPFPEAEQVRAAVEKSLHDGLEANDGTWFAQLPGKELSFYVGGEIETRYCLPDEEIAALPDDQPAEKVYRFRVRVELVEVVDG
jgi:hypothetical protein